MIGYRGYKTKELASKHLNSSLFTIIFERKGEILNKNLAKLYFLSTTKEYAKVYGEHLTSWKTSDKLLDLRTLKGQKEIAPYMKKYLNQQKESLLSNANFMMKIAKTTKEKKDALKMLDIAKNYVQPLSSLNSQWSSDNEFGIEMKKALTKLKYDGAIFSEDKRGDTIILLKRPIPLK
jgi:CMP-N-acetylneuraminic acid synthetase